MGLEEYSYFSFLKALKIFILSCNRFTLSLIEYIRILQILPFIIIIIKFDFNDLPLSASDISYEAGCTFTER